MRRRSGLAPAPIEFLPRRFYLVVIRERTACSIHRLKDSNRDTLPSLSNSPERHLFPRTPGIHYVSLQEQLLPSTPSSSDFVLGIPQTMRFNSFLTGILMHYFFLRRRHLREEIQAIHLICRWRLLYLQLPPHEALAPFEHLPYLFSSYLSSSDPFDPPNLLVSLVGIAKGLEKELLGQLGGDRANEQLEALKSTMSALRQRKVSLVVNLGKSSTELSTFTAEGLEALDISSSSTPVSSMPLTDKLPPSDEALVNRFLEACEGTEGLIAVNTSSGSGCVSAATCIGCYLMKHSNFTSQEAIGWLRFCLPVRIPLAWELFLGQMQSQMWLEGERFRRAREGDFRDEIADTLFSDAMHINIGKISLGRVSLLGTRDRDRHRADPHAANIPVTTCLSSRAQEPHQSPTAATTTAQLKRRPLTQGSAGSRRYHRSTDGTSLRADFALMHKFLHQTPSTSTRSSATSSTFTTTPLHAVPSRPKASARSPDGSPANCTEALA
ncbi:hypothetical protein PHYSODRAFT_470967 [Phytophthora sojae]|uniref:Uncharacterized protein n=1 Tax=Phytophthora sojae (strain P6497) TaxID=1094619 RepID=G4YNE3_PHYSP|nr:hypothetical protein PHYSODRAFT_470967 [Phytophthora sojae]EGZ30236.1 hypothetical protein PHYSODRAFT_470967 [Phytophthora sojae]|eukprot:XP_009517511.1 hypothetical protein PHYSODRAFT_470967 [Phytophthora sojae]